MRISRTFGIIAAAAALAFVGACGGGDDAGGDKTASKAPSSAAASPTPSGKDVLGAAVKDLNNAPYSYTMKIPEGTFTGAVDPAGKQQAKIDGVASGVKFTIEGIVIGADYYFKTSIPAAGVNTKKWYKLDRSKVKKQDMVGLFEAKDPTASQTLLDHVVTANQTAPTTVTGTYDLTKGGDLGLDDTAAITALGDKAKAVPFTATLDGPHLVSLKVTVPAYGTTPEQTISVDYAGHGQPTTIAAPKPTDVLPAPAAVYTLLNG